MDTTQYVLLGLIVAAVIIGALAYGYTKWRETGDPMVHVEASELKFEMPADHVSYPDWLRQRRQGTF